MGKAAEKRIDELLGQAEEGGSCLVPHEERDRKALRRRLKKRRSDLLCPVPGVYVRREHWRELKPDARALHVMRGLAELRPGIVFCAQSAALAWGLPVSWHLLRATHVMHERGSRTPSTPRIVSHEIKGDAAWDAGGLRVTSFWRTVFDCLASFPFEDALAIHPAEAVRRVAVVGGGPAGLKAADTAAQRGHDVTLFERRALGGYLHEASYPEFKADIRDALRYLITQVNKHHVTVVEKEATAEDLLHFDAVIVAAGSIPSGLPVPGADSPHVTLAVDALKDGGPRPTGEIVVIGGGLIGVETAVMFAAQPETHVTILEMLPQIMNGCSDSDHTVYSQWIREREIQVFTSCRVTAIDQDNVIFEHRGNTRTVPADHVFLATGMKPENRLYDELLNRGMRVFNVGDSLAPGKIYDAIHTGYKAGLKV